MLLHFFARHPVYNIIFIILTNVYLLTKTFILLYYLDRSVMFYFFFYFLFQKYYIIYFFFLRNRKTLRFDFLHSFMVMVRKPLFFDTQNPGISGFSTAHAYKYKTKRQAKMK